MTNADVSNDERREAVEYLLGVPARYVKTVEVDQRFTGEVAKASTWLLPSPLPVILLGRGDRGSRSAFRSSWTASPARGPRRRRSAWR
jgi:hypothetical protein